MKRSKVIPTKRKRAIWEKLIELSLQIEKIKENKLSVLNGIIQFN